MAHCSSLLNKISASHLTYNSSSHSNANAWHIKILFFFLNLKECKSTVGLPSDAVYKETQCAHAAFLLHNLHFVVSRMCSMVNVNKKSFQFLKSNRGRPDEQASYAVSVCVCEGEKKARRKFNEVTEEQMTFSSQCTRVCAYICAPIYPSIAFVWLNS